MYQNYGTVAWNNEQLQDITARYVLKMKSGIDGFPMLTEYIIKGHTTIENLAYDLYGNCDYAWVIMLANNIVNPFTDWLMTDDELAEYIDNVYGDAKWDVHHYELNGLIYWEPIMGSTPVTNWAYEYDKNEAKRKIQIVPKVYLNTLLEQIDSAG